MPRGLMLLLLFNFCRFAASWANCVLMMQCNGTARQVRS